MLEQSLAPQRRGADDGALAQIAPAFDVAADQGIARILAGQERGEHQAVRQHGLHVLGGMHGKIDRAGQQRLLDLLGEQALAAGVRQRPVLDRVAAGADGLDFDPVERDAARRGEAALHLPRLDQRQRRAARADAQD